MSDTWKTGTLNEVCEFHNGLWKGEKPPFVTAGVVRNTNFTKDGGLDDSDIAYLEVEERKLAKRRLQFGDIILEKSGGGPKQPVGRVALFEKTDGIFSFSNFTSALRVRDPSQLDFRFLHKFLHWTYVSGKTALIQSHSTGIRNLDIDAYAAIPIGVPSLAEQKRIVAVLDHALEAIDTATANSEKGLLNARELFQSSLAQAFALHQEGWSRSTVGAEFRFIDYRGKTPQKTKHGLRLITAKNVKMGNVQLAPQEFVSPSTYKTWMTRGIPQEGDILFTTEAPLGNVAQLDTDEKVVFAQRIIILQSERLDRAFSKFLLMSPPIQRLIHAKGTGATVKGIKASLLKTVDIWFPESISEQKAMAARLRMIEESSESLQQTGSAKVRALHRLKHSILSEAFNGKL
jgi:type I restriction enzyme, S subunit